ncbi:hypothetical protein WSK_3259 [Novosphingobium sp. Rr 2-17]|uniref:hypothetical protein n=1 Tax=Novosphingobium sp. Rr 2-17 TaxID=555793 RepID=UPI0002698BEB|nr:hypothetical protein [Novosphingobium sp. Rr 2-17]EIZ78121.1 hypothetical protein WSK_3259 [Novosphingobium sp. Rr 2-17]
MPGIDDGSRIGRSSGNSIIGGVIQRDHAARPHKVADEGGVMNHRQNRLLEVPRLFISSFYHEAPLIANFVVPRVMQNSQVLHPGGTGRNLPGSVMHISNAQWPLCVSGRVAVSRKQEFRTQAATKSTQQLMSKPSDYADPSHG